MAEETISKIYDVKIQGSDALKTLAELRLRSQELKDEQKQLGPVTADNAEQYFKLDSQIKSLNKEAAAYQKQITNSIKLQNEQERSLEALRTQLSLESAEFAKLGNTQRELARKAELGASIAATTAELKRQEEALGDHRRSVGDYEKATLSLRTEMRQLTETLVGLKIEGKENTEEYKAMSARLAQLKDAMADVNQQATSMASDTSNLDTMLQSVQGLTAAYGVWKSTSAALGVENEALEKTMAKLAIVMTALQSLTVLQNIAQKQSNVYRLAANLLQKADNTLLLQNIKARAAQNAVTASGTVVQKAAAAATWLWNAALSANPVVAVGVAIAALVAGVLALTGAFKSSSKESQAAARSMDAYKKSVEATNEVITGLERAELKRVRENDLASAQEIERLKANGATKEQLAAAELAAANRQRAVESAYATARVKEREQAHAAALQAIKDKEAEINSWTRSNKKLKEAQEELRELREEAGVLHDLLMDDAHAVEVNAQETIAANREANETIAREALATWLAMSQRRQKIEEETLKSQNVFHSSDIRAWQNFERDLFEIQQKGEKERLTARLKNRDITAKEYADEYRLLSLLSQQFYSKQSDDLNKYFADSRAKILAAAGKDTEMQIAEVVTAYDKAMKDLADVEPPKVVKGITDAEYRKLLGEYEEFLFNRAELETRLTKKMEEDIASIRENAIEAQHQKITSVIEGQYKEDYDRYANNEAKKLQVTIESLQKRIAALKEAGLSTAAEETALQATASQQNALNLERQLRDQSLSIKERHDLTEAALLAELELWEGNADKIDEINAQLVENDRAAIAARIQLAGDYMSAMGDALGALNDLLGAIDEQRLQDLQSRYDKEQAALDAQLANGLITEKAYGKQKEKLEADQAKEEAKIKREQAVRDRFAALFSIAMNTAMGIMNAINAAPPTSILSGGLPWSAIIGGIGAIQTAAVLATPLPKAARGQYVRGKSHSGGGVQMEVEGGETIINKRSASMFLPLLSAINEMGGGVPFTAPGSDGGFTIRSAVGSAGMSKHDMQTAIREAFRDVTIITTVEDYRRADAAYTNVQARGNI